MKLLHWDGADALHPATGLHIHAGDAEYPDEAADALLALGLKPVQTAAPAERKRAKGGEE